MMLQGFKTCWLRKQNAKRIARMNFGPKVGKGNCFSFDLSGGSCTRQIKMKLYLVSVQHHFSSIQIYIYIYIYLICLSSCFFLFDVSSWLREGLLFLRLSSGSMIYGIPQRDRQGAAPDGNSWGGQCVSDVSKRFMV